MSKISVTLNFDSQDELLAFFTGKATKPFTGGASLPGEGLKAADTKVEKAASAPANTAQAATKTVAKADPKVETPKQEPAAATSAQGAAAASTASVVVDYATLQKAVFALANKSREAAGEVAASLGVANFKGFEQNAEGRSAALAAVNAKLAELGA